MMEKTNKVAKITASFWILKIIATTLGETSGDALSQTLNLGYMASLAITTAFFLFVLALQLRSRRFYPVLYWAVIVGTTTVGTEISDAMDRTFGLGYVKGSIILFSLLMIALAFWYYREKNLEVYPIDDRGKETFYWITVLLSNSLGTAFGDFLSDNLGLGFKEGALLCLAIIIIVLLFHYFTRINQIILFWIAFVFTRPFGATFGDLLTKPIAHGGLNLGTFHATTVAAALLALLLIYSTWESKVEKRH